MGPHEVRVYIQQAISVGGCHSPTYSRDCEYVYVCMYVCVYVYIRMCVCFFYASQTLCVLAFFKVFLRVHLGCIHTYCNGILFWSEGHTSKVKTI